MEIGYFKVGSKPFYCNALPVMKLFLPARQTGAQLSVNGLSDMSANVRPQIKICFCTYPLFETVPQYLMK